MTRRSVLAFVALLVAASLFAVANATAKSQQTTQKASTRTTVQRWAPAGGLASLVGLTPNAADSAAVCHTARQGPLKYYSYAFVEAVTTCTDNVLQIWDTMYLYRNGALVSSSANLVDGPYEIDEVVSSCGGGGHTWRSDMQVCETDIDGTLCAPFPGNPVWLNSC
jgi:hypothetical protein